MDGGIVGAGGAAVGQVPLHRLLVHHACVLHVLELSVYKEEVSWKGKKVIVSVVVIWCSTENGID